MPKRTQNYVATTNLARLHKLGIDNTAIAKECGIGRASLKGWEAAKSMPRYASVACEALIRRQGKNGARKVVIVQCDPGDLDVLQRLLDALGADCHIL